MVSKEQLVQITESSIDSLITTFKKNQFFFYTENDLHCHLFTEIFRKLPLEEWKCETEDKKPSILLHKEYPTKVRYVAATLKEVKTGGARGHFDLCIWNPDKTRNKLFRVTGSTDFEHEQQTFIAIELDMIMGNRTLESALHHFEWDLLKLRGYNNEVEHGYQLVFIRDWLHKDEFPVQAMSEAAKAQNTTILYIESDKNQIHCGTLSPKPFLNYPPA